MEETKSLKEYFKFIFFKTFIHIILSIIEDIPRSRIENKVLNIWVYTVQIPYIYCY